MRQVLELIEQLAASGRGESAPALSPLAAGKWRLRWSAQVQSPPLPRMCLLLHGMHTTAAARWVPAGGI
jgi:hypothetical protein